MTFQTTRWSLILRARRDDSDGAQALDELLTAYWQPVYVFFRRLGADREAAADLTQGLFADLLARGDLAGVDPERGRFRGFLRSCARHWWANERARKNAEKRGGAVNILPLTDDAESWLAREPIDTDDAEAIFERRWAETVVERALCRLEQQEHSAGRGAQFAVLRRCLDHGAPPQPWLQLAADLDTSEGALKVAAHRLKARLRACVVAEARETLTDATAPGEELRELLTALERPGRGGPAMPSGS